jgi:hypothetical protein
MNSEQIVAFREYKTLHEALEAAGLSAQGAADT